MAYSYTQISADGSTNTFAVPFSYISKSHVAVTVDGVATTFTWPTTATVTLTDTAASLTGKTVEIRRTTPRATRLVDFQDAANVTESMLDTSALQQFYIAQEVFDDNAAKLTLVADGAYDALTHKIKNLADGTADQDAVTFVQLTNAALSPATPNATSIAFTPVGTVAATDVQTAIAEVAAEYAAADALAVHLAGAETVSGDKDFTGLQAFAKTKFSVPHGPRYLNNISCAATQQANDLTIHLLGNDGAAPSATNPSQLAFRSATLTVGTTTVATAVAATTVVVPSTATLGFGASEESYLYIYALNNAGVIEAAICGSALDTNILHTTTAVSAAADSRSVLYSTTARTNVAIRFVGLIKIATGVTPGHWSFDPTIQATAAEAPPMLALGYGQTWQNVTGSRALATTYTNTTGRPIQVSIVTSTFYGFYTALVTLTAGASSPSVTIATSQKTYNGSTNNGGILYVTGIIPPGHTYSVAMTNCSIQSWAELR